MRQCESATDFSDSKKFYDLSKTFVDSGDERNSSFLQLHSPLLL